MSKTFEALREALKNPDDWMAPSDASLCLKHRPSGMQIWWGYCDRGDTYPLETLGWLERRKVCKIVRAMLDEKLAREYSKRGPK